MQIINITTDKPYKEKVNETLRRGKSISLKSFFLRKSGEEKLRYILKEILCKLNRNDLEGILLAAVRELAQNASKASFKRILFKELNLELKNESQYQKGIKEFHKYLIAKQLSRYRYRLYQSGYYFKVNFVYDNFAIIISVINVFTLLPVEEKRIREKFSTAQNMTSLYDFFIQFGDNTEGAGMGIAMIEILLNQAGIDPHNFTVFSDLKKEQTIARLIIPIDRGYISTREQFNKEKESRGCSTEELRRLVGDGKVILKLRMDS